MRTLVVALLLVAASRPIAAAEQWIALGGMGFELDATTVEVGQDGARGWIRKVGATAQGQLTTRMLVVAHCKEDLLEIERGVLESDWSAKVVEMPELPPEDRFLQIPVQNPAFNNLYSYLCR